jgi:hypothetical protein
MEKIIGLVVWRFEGDFEVALVFFWDTNFEFFMNLQSRGGKGG